MQLRKEKLLRPLLPPQALHPNVVVDGLRKRRKKRRGKVRKMRLRRRRVLILRVLLIRMEVL